MAYMTVPNTPSYEKRYNEKKTFQGITLKQHTIAIKGKFG
jgi:hypothetical protein